MDKYSKSQLARNFNRSNDIEVSDGFKKQLEEKAIAHLAAGNMTEYMVCMTSLGKIETMNALNAKVDDTSDIVKKLAKTVSDLTNKDMDGIV
tara:strand:+ start:963 stop:1238 length:276 start_codon:yes stop_codon:yes gene_type:complete